MSAYQAVYLAYRSRFDDKTLFERIEDAKEHDRKTATSWLGVNYDVPRNVIAIKVMYDAIIERELAEMMAKYREAIPSDFIEAEAPAALAASE